MDKIDPENTIMLTIPASEMKQRFGKYLNSALQEPVVIEKSGHPTAVMLSLAEYERLHAIEDAWWGAQAEKALQSGWVGMEETQRRLQDKLNAEG